MSPRPASAQEPLRPAEAAATNLSTLTASHHLDEAKKRWARFAALDLSRPLTRLPFFVRPRTAEAYRLRLAEAWRHTQTALRGFEADLRRMTPALEQCRLSVEAFKAEVLTRYCAYILSYQAELGRQGRLQIPLEWMQQAAAGALLSVLHTALLLWALHRAPRPRLPRARRQFVTAPCARSFVSVPVAKRALSLPLLC